MSECKPASTPLDATVKLSLDSGQKHTDIEGLLYIRRLLYLTRTIRPDIAFATHQLSHLW